MPRVALVTCADLPDLDPDDRLLATALAERGIEAVPAVWDRAEVEWGSFDLAVVRSPWDYAGRREEFLARLERLPRVLNPPEVLRWNTDKRYLQELRTAGLPTVRTTFIEPDDSLVLAVPPEGLVVKPAVSAGSRDTARHHEVRHALEHVAVLQDAGRTAMVQPYLPAVDSEGETGLLYVDGAFSHAVRKGPMLGGDRPDAGLFLEEEIEPRTPSADEREVAEAVMAHVRERFGDQLYARVDLLRDGAGAPVVLEVELTEPSLFLAHAPGAAERLAAAVAARL